jgi:hypothetical protein
MNVGELQERKGGMDTLGSIHRTIPFSVSVLGVLARQASVSRETAEMRKDPPKREGTGIFVNVRPEVKKRFFLIGKLPIRI